MAQRGDTLFIPGTPPGTDQLCVRTLQPDGTLAWTPVVLGPPIPDPPQPPRPVQCRPSDLLDLTNWKLTIPAGKTRDATEVTQPDLAGYSSSFFHLPPSTPGTRRGVVCMAPCDAPTTSGSTYPRTELRQMVGARPAGWSCATDRTRLTVVASVDVLPRAKPQVVCAQIHDAADDVVEVLASGLDSTRGPGHIALTVRWRGKTQPQHLDDDYTLGTPFRVDLDVPGDGTVGVSYNERRILVLRARNTGCYFKSGAYVQSNPQHGDGGDQFGQVTLYALTVT